MTCLLCGAARGAEAQAQSDQPLPLPPPSKPKPVGQMDFGPLTLTPSVALLNVGVDNNVLNSQGTTQSDFTATVSPQIKLLYKAGRLSVDSTTTGDYIFYRSVTDQGGFAPRTMLSAEYRIGRRITLLANDQIEFRKDRPSIDIDSRVRHTSAMFGFGVRVGIGPKVDLEIGARQTDITYSPDAIFRGVALRDTLNQSTRTAQGTLAFRLTPYTTLKSVVTIDDQKFPRSFNRDGQSNLYGGGFSFSPRALLSGDAIVGYRQFWSHSPAEPDFNGLAADGRLVLRLGDLTGFLVSLRRDLVPSFEPTSPYAVQLSYQTAIQQQIARHFDVGLSYASLDLDYQPFTDSPAVPAGNNIVRDYGVSVGFLSARMGRYAIYIDHWDRSWSADPSRSYTDNRVGFMITPTRWLNGNASRGFLVNTAGL